MLLQLWPTPTWRSRNRCWRFWPPFLSTPKMATRGPCRSWTSSRSVSHPLSDVFIIIIIFFFFLLPLSLVVLVLVLVVVVVLLLLLLLLLFLLLFLLFLVVFLVPQVKTDSFDTAFVCSLPLTEKHKTFDHSHHGQLKTNAISQRAVNRNVHTKTTKRGKKPLG